MQNNSRLFQSTCWRHFHDLNSGNPAKEKRALNQICQTYWKPLYHFALSLGCKHEDAEDCVQAFLTGASTNRLFTIADPEKGRMRSYLLVAFKRFIYDVWKKNNAQKRGGNVTTISATDEIPLTSDTPDPALAYDQHWAVVIVEHAKSNLKNRYQDQGKETLYTHLEPCIDGKNPDSLENLAQTLNLSIPALKSAIHRIRQRFGDEIRAAVAETVADENEIDTELSWLIQVLSK